MTTNSFTSFILLHHHHHRLLILLLQLLTIHTLIISTTPSEYTSFSDTNTQTTAGTTATTTATATVTTNKQEDVVKYIIRNLSTGGSGNGNGNGNGSSSWMSDEDATILDVFGQVAKDVLTNRLVSTSTWYEYNTTPGSSTVYWLVTWLSG